MTWHDMINSFDFDTKTVGHIVMKYDYLKNVYLINY